LITWHPDATCQALAKEVLKNLKQQKHSQGPSKILRIVNGLKKKKKKKNFYRIKEQVVRRMTI
jgi:hypothetical protein